MFTSNNNYIFGQPQSIIEGGTDFNFMPDSLLRDLGLPPIGDSSQVSNGAWEDLSDFQDPQIEFVSLIHVWSMR